MPTITFLLLAILAAIASGAHSPPIPKRFPAYNSVDARAAELFIMFHLVHCVCNEHRVRKVLDFGDKSKIADTHINPNLGSDCCSTNEQRRYPDV